MRLPNEKEVSLNWVLPLTYASIALIFSQNIVVVDPLAVIEDLEGAIFVTFCVLSYLSAIAVGLQLIVGRFHFFRAFYFHMVLISCTFWRASLSSTGYSIFKGKCTRTTSSWFGIIFVQKPNCIFGNVSCTFSHWVDTRGISVPSVWRWGKAYLPLHKLDRDNQGRLPLECLPSLRTQAE